MVWIKKFKNDPRDFLIKTHEIEMKPITIETKPPEYDLNKQYEVTLCQETDDVTGKVSYYWLEESKQKVISPRFQTADQANFWMKVNTGN